MNTKKVSVFVVALTLLVLSFCFSSVVFATGTSIGVTSVDKDFVNVTLKDKSDDSVDIFSESKNGGALDWVTYVIKLNSKDSGTLEDVQSKSGDKRSVFPSEDDVAGTIYVPAKSRFRYLDLSALLSDVLTNAVFGDSVKEKVNIPLTDGHVYLVRSYSGAFGVKDDAEERTFAETNISKGASRNESAFVLNVLAMSLDGIAIVAPVGLVSGGEDGTALKEIVKDVMVSALSENAVKAIGVETQSPNKMNAILRTATDIGQSILKKSSQIIVENLKDEAERSALRNSVTFIGDIGTAALSVVDPLKKISKGGQVLDRAYDLVYNATPLETAYVINSPLVGEGKQETPRKPDESKKTEPKSDATKITAPTGKEVSPKTETTSKTKGFASKFLTLQFIDQYGNIDQSGSSAEVSIVDGVGESVTTNGWWSILCETTLEFYATDHKRCNSIRQFPKEILPGTYTVSWADFYTRSAVGLYGQFTGYGLDRFYKRGTKKITVPQDGNWFVQVPVEQTKVTYDYTYVTLKIQNELATDINFKSHDSLAQNVNVVVYDSGGKEVGGIVLGYEGLSVSFGGHSADPGEYTIQIKIDGYQPKDVRFTLRDISSWSDERIYKENPGKIDLGTIVLKKL